MIPHIAIAYNMLQTQYSLPLSLSLSLSIVIPLSGENKTELGACVAVLSKFVDLKRRVLGRSRLGALFSLSHTLTHSSLVFCVVSRHACYSQSLPKVCCPLLNPCPLPHVNLLLVSCSNGALTCLEKWQHSHRLTIDLMTSV